MNPRARAYYAPDPAPGVYAISATNLQGVHFADHDQFAWFREKEPLHKLGHSIFLYEVPATGEPVDLLLSGLQMDDLPPGSLARLGSNDVRPRWIEAEQSVILPAGENAWLARPSGQSPPPALAPYVQEALEGMNEGDGIEIGRYNPRPFQSATLARFLAAGAAVSLLETQILASDSAHIELVTAWRKEGPPQALQLFVHALDENGRLVAQWDGLGAAWEGWLDGDVLLQRHLLTLPPDAAAPLTLVSGVYDPLTGARWQTEEGVDAFELQFEN